MTKPQPIDSVRHEILQRIRRIIVDDLHAATDIGPTTVALRAFKHYARAEVEVHVEYTSMEHLKHLAREVLAAKHDPVQRAADAGDDDEQADAFAHLLQERYPIRVPKGSEPQYRRRESLSDDDVLWNIARMSTAARGLLEHVDALRAWHDARRAAA